MMQTFEEASDRNLLQFYLDAIREGRPQDIPLRVRRKLRRAGLITYVGGGRGGVSRIVITEKGRRLI